MGRIVKTVYTPQPYDKRRKNCNLEYIKVGRAEVKCCKCEDGYWYCLADIWFLLHINNGELRHNYYTHLKMNGDSYMFDFGFIKCVMAQATSFTKLKRVRSHMQYKGISFLNGTITITQEIEDTDEQ